MVRSVCVCVCVLHALIAIHAACVRWCNNHVAKPYHTVGVGPFQLWKKKFAGKANPFRTGLTEQRFRRLVGDQFLFASGPWRTALPS